jgi:adenine-specific DNA-methyltransferase
MTLLEIPKIWSSKFGLALAPLFEHNEVGESERHHVLLDGGHGTFAMSIADDEIWHEPHVAAWAWSSDSPHHVTVTNTKVAVLRWDQPADVRVFGRPSIDRNLDGFYRFLADDRVRSTKTVVDHLLSLFRRVRSLNHAAGIADERSTDVFLLTLARLITSDDVAGSPEQWGIAEDVTELYARLNSRALAAALDDIRRATGSLTLLELYPALAVRHAGGQLFQEAHFELFRVPSIDLFDHIGAPQIKKASRGGAHFTPPALARILVEQAFANIDDVSNRAEITICDPACGSGAFLHEALRALRRLGFSGHLTLVGLDVSTPAIAMAAFALRCAVRDWSPEGGIELRLTVTDSLSQGAIPSSDVIVMNPPFISWGAQTAEQRMQLEAALGRSRSSRGDLSMAFVVRAIEALKPGGVLGTLFPASLLSLQASADWRARLTEHGDVRLLAAIGDYGLFTQALVQIACAVIRKSGSSPNKVEMTALVSNDDPRATGDALRCLRKIGAEPPGIPITEKDWSVFALPAEALRTRVTWRFPSPEADAAIRRIEEALLPTIGDLFEVQQGIQTGLDQALLLTETEWRSLPVRERTRFRRATMSDSIQNGKVPRPYYVFFPHTAAGPLFSDEDTVRAAVPQYFKLYLLPHKQRLVDRASIRRSGRQDWWGLMEPRVRWSTAGTPRIITKYFTAEGGFCGDYKAEYLPVKGFAWFPTQVLRNATDDAIEVNELLASYIGFFNSKTFIKLLAVYSPHVSGGQFTLEPRYVNTIPIPNLGELSLDPIRGRLVTELAELGTTVDLTNPHWRARSDQVVSDLYGRDIIAGL